jgi:peptidoglycan/xylan/chitin deacetylase (PgdA/CDA1 family)
LNSKLDESIFKDHEELFKVYKSKKSAILSQFSNVGSAIKDKIKKSSQEWNQFLIDSGVISRDPNAAVKCYYRPSSDTCGDMAGFAYKQGSWVLTFDDGPHPTRTVDIINFLGEKQINAVFFTMGKNFVYLKKNDPTTFKNYLELFKAKGMIVGNHSMNHPQMSKVAVNLLNTEIADVSKLLAQPEHFGMNPEYMRLPYGDGNKVGSRVREEIAKAGMIHMFWNVDTLDWQDKDPVSILNRAWKQMVVNQRGIVLFHDIHPQSIAASKMLVNKVLDEGKKYNFKFRPINEVRDEMNSRPGVVKPN